MRPLLEYLNGLAVSEQIAFAGRCSTTVGYLRKAASVGQPLREKLCAALERESHGYVKRIALRPDDWAEIWPELADSKPNPPPAPVPPAQAAINCVVGEVASA